MVLLGWMTGFSDSLCCKLSIIFSYFEHLSEATCWYEQSFNIPPPFVLEFSLVHWSLTAKSVLNDLIQFEITFSPLRSLLQAFISAIKESQFHFKGSDSSISAQHWVSLS